MILFTKSPRLNKKEFFFFWGGGGGGGGEMGLGGGGARVSKIYFTKNPNQKKKNQVWGLGRGGATVREFFYK